MPAAAAPTLNWDSHATQEALNILSIPVMIADGDLVVRFVNEAGFQMLEHIEDELRADQPDFMPRDVVGKPADLLHRDPAFRADTLAKKARPVNGKVHLGGVTLAYRATPVTDDKGRLAMVYLEWQDRTFFLQRQDQTNRLVTEINRMAEMHRQGIISHFIDAEGYDDDLRVVVEGTNEMVRDHINTKTKILSCMTEFAAGNFEARIEKFSGERFFINDAVEGIRSGFKKVKSEIERFCAALESGDLSITLDVNSFPGDYRAVVTMMEGALVSLSRTIMTATEQVQQVAITVEQMSQSSQALATNSQIQSSSVDEVSASTEQTNIQVKSNAAAADNASKLVEGTAVVAANGTTKISEMVSAMDGIRSSSHDIAKIIKVIDEIAFQTNLLALNAAVEAARAGQHGRGFAVVAQEVRNLAGRSAKAARETSDLIEDASARVQSGVRIADETREAFSRIADDIRQVQTLVNEIAVASDEQARGVTQINAAIGDIAKTALATSQQADELAASSNEMQVATETIRRDFSRFRLRPVEVPAARQITLDSLSPEMLAQLRLMFEAQMNPAVKPNGDAGKKANGALHLPNADHDERGFANF